MEEPKVPEILEMMQAMFRRRPPGGTFFPIAADHYDALMSYTLAIQDLRRSRGEHPTRAPISTRGPGYPLHFHGEGFGVRLQRREDLSQPIPDNWRAAFGEEKPPVDLAKADLQAKGRRYRKKPKEDA